MLSWVTKVMDLKEKKCFPNLHIKESSWFRFIFVKRASEKEGGGVWDWGGMGVAWGALHLNSMRPLTQHIHRASADICLKPSLSLSLSQFLRCSCLLLSHLEATYRRRKPNSIFNVAASTNKYGPWVGVVRGGKDPLLLNTFLSSYAFNVYFVTYSTPMFG